VIEYPNLPPEHSERERERVGTEEINGEYDMALAVI
jgi:hypothetical protein